MFLLTSPIVINVPTRGLLAVETMHAIIVQWLANLNIKRNMTSMFVNKKHRYNNRCKQENDHLTKPQISEKKFSWEDKSQCYKIPGAQISRCKMI